MTLQQTLLAESMNLARGDSPGSREHSGENTRAPSESKNKADHYNSSLTYSPMTSSKPVITFDNTKAGLQEVDKEKTEALIAEISKGSSFYDNEKKKLKIREEKVKKLLEKKKQFDPWKKMYPLKYEKLVREIDEKEKQREQERYHNRIFAHLDMDMFYAAVEEKNNPHLKEVPLGVGSMGMLSTTNYIARQYGVRAGMPGFIGLKLCPQLVIVPLDLKAYKAESHRVRRIAADFDPNFVSHGWDELTMELTGHVAFQKNSQMVKDAFQCAEKAVEECRRRIFEETGLTASAGIASSPSLAKMASNYQKPNGQYCIALDSSEGIREYLAEKSVRAIQGIGKSTEFLLNGVGIRTLGELYENRYWLGYLFPEKTFDFLLGASIGSCHGFFDYASENGEEGDSNAPPQKSKGEESTFPPLDSFEELVDIARSHLHKALEFVREHDLLVGHMVLRLKYRSYQVKYFSLPVVPPSDNEEALARVLDELLGPLRTHYNELRLIGVRVEKLVLKSSVDLQNAVTSGDDGAPLPIQRKIEDFLPPAKRLRTQATEDRKSHQKYCVRYVSEEMNEECFVVSSSEELPCEDEKSIEVVDEEVSSGRGTQATVSQCSSLVFIEPEKT